MLHVRIAELTAEREAAAAAEAQKQRLLHDLEAEAQRVRLIVSPVQPIIVWAISVTHNACISDLASGTCAHVVVA